jgi:hypothetical protein
MLSNFFIFIFSQKETKKRKNSVIPIEAPDALKDKFTDHHNLGKKEDYAGGFLNKFGAPVPLDPKGVRIEVVFEEHPQPPGNVAPYGEVWHESTEDLALLPITADAICNCVEFGLLECLLFNEEFINDMGKIIDFPEGKLPNELRFSLYKLSFSACNSGTRRKGLRKKQPNCVVAKIKLLCPSNSNEYVGFKEQKEDN